MALSKAAKLSTSNIFFYGAVFLIIHQVRLLRLVLIPLELSSIDDAESLTSSTNFGMESGAECVSIDYTLDKLVASSTNTFIMMPARAAGSSLKRFTDACVGQYDNTRRKKSSLLNQHNIDGRIDLFVQSANHPPILASQAYGDKAAISAIRNIPRDSLLVYVYREETDRLLSAIKEVVVMEVCQKNIHPDVPREVDGNNCIVDEMDVVEKIIKVRKTEIKYGAPEIMTCAFYEAIEQNFPNMVFLDYRQADRLQNILAQHHCPEHVGAPFHRNLDEKKKMDAFVKLTANGEKVDVNEWLENKRGLLEWTFGLRGKGNKCQAKTRQMEDELDLCEDKLLKVTRNTSF